MSNGINLADDAKKMAWLMKKMNTPSMIKLVKIFPLIFMAQLSAPEAHRMKSNGHDDEAQEQQG